jgi:chaperonin GroES
MATLTYQPMEDRLIVEPESAEQTTSSGIVIPTTAQEKPQLGKVIKVGPGKTTDEGKLIPMDIKEGELVMYSKYSGTEIKIEGNEYLIIKKGDVLAKKVG